MPPKKPKKKGRPKKQIHITKHADSASIASRYDNFMFLDLHRVSDHREVKSVIDVIFQQMSDKGIVPKQEKYADSLRHHVRIVLLNLFVAHFSDPVKYVAYPRNESRYKSGTQYHKIGLSYRMLVENVIQFLLDNGYIVNTKGHRFSDSKKISRMRATRKLMTIAVEENMVTPPMIQRDLKDTVLRLRNDRKKEISYVDTPETLLMKASLRKINDCLRRSCILLYITDDMLRELNHILNSSPDPDERRGGSIDFTETQLHRVFNNSSWEKGGRFYGGWWQRIPREYRKYIRINGKDVVELDYSGLHVNMLYAMEKLPMPEGDVYKIEGYSNDRTFRSFVKSMLLMMVNAGSREATRKALQSAIYRQKVLVLPPEIPSVSQSDLYPLMDAFEEKHQPIRHYFNSGIGIDLQFLDSQIAEKVLVRFTEIGYPALPLHDSFVVHHGLEGELKETMNRAFHEIFGVDGKVDLKYRSIDKREKEERENGTYVEGPFDTGNLDAIFDDGYGKYDRAMSAYWALGRIPNVEKKEVEKNKIDS